MKMFNNHTRSLSLISLCAIAFCSCEKVVDLKSVGDASAQIVIEGNITNIDSAQYVHVSYSVSASATTAPPPVTDAVVTVTDEENETYNFVQSAPGTYMLKSIITKPGETYTLHVQEGGKIYTASSQMPAINVKIDTMSISRVDVGSTSYRAVNTFFYDPGISNNQYRFVMTVNGVQMKTIFVMNNDLVKGKYAYDVLFPYDVVLKVGDVVWVELQCIDKVNYNYWYSLSQQQSSAALPLDNSSKSVNPVSNFNNNALGYFSAHTSNSKKYVIYGPKS
jgi:hypothetical protein